MRSTACADHLAVFDACHRDEQETPPTLGLYQRAQRVCLTECLDRRACLEQNRDEAAGVWGGTTPTMRKAMAGTGSKGALWDNGNGPDRAVSAAQPGPDHLLAQPSREADG